MMASKTNLVSFKFESDDLDKRKAFSADLHKPNNIVGNNFIKKLLTI